MPSPTVWAFEDGTELAPEAGEVFDVLSRMITTTAEPRDTAVIWPASSSVVIPVTDAFASAAHTLDLTQYAYAQPAAAGGSVEAVQTLSLTQSAIPRAGYKATALQPISLTSQGASKGGALRTAIQTFSLTQQAVPKVGLRAAADQTLSLTQSAIPQSLSASAIQTLSLTQLADNTRQVTGIATQSITLAQTVAERLGYRATVTQGLDLAQIARPLALSALIVQTLPLTQEADGVRGVEGLVDQTLLFSQPDVLTVLARTAAAVATLPLTQALVSHVDLIGVALHPIYPQQIARPKDLDISLLPIPVRPDIIIQRDATTHGGVTAAPGDVVVSSQQYS